MSEYIGVKTTISVFQSGSLYQPWGWFQSDGELKRMVAYLMKAVKCKSKDIYSCYQGMSGDQVLKSLPTDFKKNPFHPVSDDDFFTLSVNDESYELTQR